MADVRQVHCRAVCSFSAARWRDEEGGPEQVEVISTELGRRAAVPTHHVLVDVTPVRVIDRYAPRRCSARTP
jgi:hypothetical protein